ncbi:MAG: DUF6483 family protein [Thermoleophilia bacterium]
MAQRDYLVRQLETFMRGLARAVLLREAQREVTAALVLDDLSERFLGVRATELATLTYRALTSRIAVGGEGDLDRRLMAADVLDETALLMEAEGRSEAALPVYALSFRLLAEIGESRGGGAVEGREGRLDRAASRLLRADLDRDTLILLWRHQLRMGRYAAAEDILFPLLEAAVEGGRQGEAAVEGGRQGSRLVAEGVEAYEALLERSDADLESGGLPRDEVLESLEELRARRSRHLHPPLSPG